ncbi:MAG: hypothetical protein J6L81_05730 [Clostridia bacterium]|nr:hypothetical protein [Clostridia bacterium]
MMNGEMYKRALEIIGDLTPLRGHDCGMLCDCACCKGGEEGGMLLFPGESTELNITNTQEGQLAVCSGSCDRDKRPLACRIFPFFPDIRQKRVKAVIDSRALRLCPIAYHSKNVKFDKSFIKAVEKVGELLRQDEHCRQFMLEVIEDIELIQKFYI